MPLLILRLRARVRYEQAEAWLARSWLVSPCYLILAGEGPHQAALYTRSRWGHSQRRALGEHGGALVQCNTDHWDCDPLVDVLASVRPTPLFVCVCFSVSLLLSLPCICMCLTGSGAAPHG
jgi:hypothetical protein